MRSLKSDSSDAAEAAPLAATIAPVPAVENPFRREPSPPESRLRWAGIELEASDHRANRRLNAISIILPAAGTVAAFTTLPVIQPSFTTLAIFVLSFALTGFGITLGLHRYFTHRAFSTSPVVIAALAVFGTWSFQGPIVRWVADHRRHHRFSDREFDPHSPYWNEHGPIESKVDGFLHSHLLWMFTGLRSSEKRYAADIAKSKIARFVSRFYWPVAASGILLPAAAGLAFGGASEMISCALWAGFVRIALLHQLTWSVNSFGHMLGTRPAGAADEARDNRVLALLILGEGLHGFHHLFPSAAIKSPSRFDATGGFIAVLEKLGVVWNVDRVVAADR